MLTADLQHEPDGTVTELVGVLPGSGHDSILSNGPASTEPGAVHLARLAKIRWRIEHDYRELKDGLGPDHFKGRTFTGWRRHVTLIRVAQALCTQLRRSPKAPAPA